jgi:bifunctional DNA-binding transcriptional regulator/antitoxin component of YhaV-PrlF toxin-antitoxin module
MDDKAAILTMTSKGQVTLRKDLRAHLRLKAGQQLVARKTPDGSLVLSRAPSGKISDAFNLFRAPKGKALSIEDMNDIIADGWAGKR